MGRRSVRVLLNAVAKALGDDVTVVGPVAGLHVVVGLNCVPWVGIYSVSGRYDPDALARRPAVAGLVIG